MKHTGLKRYGFLKWLLIIAAWWVLLDFIVLGMLRHLPAYLPAKTDRVHYAALSADEDLIVIGNSLARSGINVNRMRDTLRISAFNAGVNATGLRFQSLLISEILRRHTPKMIIWVVSPIHYVEGDRMLYQQMIKSLYGLGSRELDAEIERCYPRRKYLFFSNAFLMNNTFSQFLYDRLTASRRDSLNGYDPYIGNIHPLDTVRSAYKPFSQREKALLRQTAALCKQSGVDLIIVTPPALSAPAAPCAMTDYLRSLPDATFYDDLTLSPIAGNPMNFCDLIHLHRSGAERYTDTLIYRLRTLHSH